MLNQIRFNMRLDNGIFNVISAAVNVMQVGRRRSFTINTFVISNLRRELNYMLCQA